MKFPWYYPPSWRRLIILEAKIEILISLQETLQKQLLEVVSSISNTSAEQTKVFSTWVSLFTKNQDQTPRRWVSGEQKDETGLNQKKMPDNLSEKEQAEWVRKQLNF